MSLSTCVPCWQKPRRAGDELAGLAAPTRARRVVARMALADLPLKTFLNECLVPCETDEVTRLIVDTHDTAACAPLSAMTVGDFREYLLDEATDAAALKQIAPGVTPEMAAAVSKLMTYGDLVAAAKARVVTAFRTTLGLEGRLASRPQPNHPTDDIAAIAAATLDGLAFGMGDAALGVNPATDNVDTTIRILAMFDELRRKLYIPAQSCVLSHVTPSIAAMEKGAPLDLVFQSVAGTQAANAGFGVLLSILR